MGKKVNLDPKKMREALIAALHDPHFSDDDSVKEPKKKPKKPGQDS